MDQSSSSSLSPIGDVMAAILQQEIMRAQPLGEPAATETPVPDDTTTIASSSVSIPAMAEVRPLDAQEWQRLAGSHHRGRTHRQPAVGVPDEMKKATALGDDVPDLVVNEPRAPPVATSSSTVPATMDEWLDTKKTSKAASLEKWLDQYETKKKQQQQPMDAAVPLGAKTPLEKWLDQYDEEEKASAPVGDDKATAFEKWLDENTLEKKEEDLMSSTSTSPTSSVTDETAPIQGIFSWGKKMVGAHKEYKKEKVQKDAIKAKAKADVAEAKAKAAREVQEAKAALKPVKAMAAHIVQQASAPAAQWLAVDSVPVGSATADHAYLGNVAMGRALAQQRLALPATLSLPRPQASVGSAKASMAQSLVFQRYAQSLGAAHGTSTEDEVTFAQGQGQELYQAVHETLASLPMAQRPDAAHVLAALSNAYQVFYLQATQGVPSDALARVATFYAAPAPTATSGLATLVRDYLA